MPRLILALALLAIAAPTMAQDRAQLDAVSVHLFLEKSGTLSDDITAMDGFAANNFSPDGPGIAEGERFDSILIKVRLTARGEAFAKGPQAEVTLSDRKTKKVVKRASIADVYIGPGGVAFVPVFAENVACVPLDVTATGGGKRIVKSLNFHCGE